MTPEELNQRIDQVASEVAPMLKAFLKDAHFRIGSTSTTEYMRDAGVTSPPFPPRKSASGPLRRLSGRLAASIARSRVGRGTREGISEAEIAGDKVILRIGSRVPYAGVHEEGFSGRVQVAAHQRRITQAFGRPLDRAKTVDVAAHGRSITIPARPYLGPAVDDNLGWLQEELSRRFVELVVKSLDG